MYSKHCLLLRHSLLPNSSLFYLLDKTLSLVSPSSFFLSLPLPLPPSLSPLLLPSLPPPSLPQSSVAEAGGTWYSLKDGQNTSGSVSELDSEISVDLITHIPQGKSSCAFQVSPAPLCVWHIHSLNLLLNNAGLHPSHT